MSVYDYWNDLGDQHIFWKCMVTWSKGTVKFSESTEGVGRCVQVMWTSHRPKYMSLDGFPYCECINIEFY